MKIFPITSLLILTLALFSCEQDEDKPALQGCCETPAIDADFGNAHVYLPNIFTPNNDGINDLLSVYGDSIQEIINFEIRNSEDELVYQVENIHLYDTLNIWDGTVNGVVEKGLYDISLTLKAFDGTITSFAGKTCNYPCGSVEESEMVDGTPCQFPIQQDNGHYHPNIAPQEPTDCYK